MTLETTCIKCKRGATPNNQLIKCEIPDCYLRIHDGCIGITEAKREQGRLVWLCTHHLKAPQTGNTQQAGQSTSNTFDPMQNVNVRKRNSAQNIIDENALIDTGNGQNGLPVNTPALVNPFNDNDSIVSSNDGDDDDDSQTSNVRNNDNNTNGTVKNVNCDHCNDSVGRAITISCLGCDRLLHYDCASQSEMCRINGNNFICDTCFRVQTRLTQSLEHNSVLSNTQNANNSNYANREPPNASRNYNNNHRKYARFSNNNTRYEYTPQSARETRYPPSNRYSQHPAASSPRNNPTNNRPPQISPIPGNNVTYYAKSSTRYSNRPSNATRTFDTNALNESYMTMMEKMDLKELPEVTDNNVSWCTFYETYMNTKHLFHDHENVVRIKKAIKDPEALQIGGANLFITRTYHEAIEKINRRLGRNLTFLNKEAQALQTMPRLKAENHKKIIDYIDKVVNFSALAKAFKDASYTSNKVFINCLSQKLPPYLHNKWISKQCYIESQGAGLDLQHLVEVLEDELPNVTTRLRNSMLPAYDDIKPYEHAKPQRNHNTDVNTTDMKKPKFDKSCWFHKSEQHPSHKCHALWNMDGKDVCELAKKNNRCVTCGQAEHFTCPFKEKLKICPVNSCGYKHYSLYCPKRKGNVKPKNHSNNNTALENRVSPSEYDPEEIDEIANELNSMELDVNEEEEMYSHREGNKFILERPERQINQNSHIWNMHVTSGAVERISLSHDSEKYSLVRSSPFILGVLVVKLENKVNAAFLIDSGSTVSLIEENLANELNLFGPKFPLSLKWSGDQTREDKISRVVKINVSSTSNNAKSHEIYFRTFYELRVNKQKFVAKDYVEQYPYLKQLNLVDYENIAGIIGIDNLWVFDQQTIKAKNHTNDMPFGIRCPLGDYVMGTKYPLQRTYEELLGLNWSPNQPVNIHSSVAYNYTSKVRLTEREILELEEMEKSALDIDSNIVLESDSEIHDDKRALEMLANNVKRIDGSVQFEAPLLWKEDDVTLPTADSYKLASRRFFLVEKLSKANHSFEECEKQIRNLLEKNYAKELTPEEIVTTTNKTFYIPIFFIKPEGKRQRMIWDMAAKVNGRSINDELLSGPNLYNDLLQIIFQMSENRYLIKGDLQEMFHQIRIKEEDTDALRFVFRFQNDNKLRVFKMLVLPFGAKCSPTISQYVKNLVATEFLSKYPLASDTILYSTYVDDVIKSLSCAETAKTLPLEIRKILEKAGFSLLKINSNDKGVLNHLKDKFALENISHENLFSNGIEEKLLGYKINFEKDTISLAFSLSKLEPFLQQNNKIPSKREVLKVLMAIYDPVGFFQFITSKMKLLYRELCVNKCEWDELVPLETIKDWLKIIDWLRKALTLEIPRCYCYMSYDKVELWAFADAGEYMMCGTIYARYLNDRDEQVSVRLIYAKTHTAPIKTKRTIPQLELQASVDLCKMVKTTLESHQTTFNKLLYFTDNAAVFEWIVNGAKKPTVYVRNRLIKVNDTSPKLDWNWIPTDFMPADYGTKDTSMPEIRYDNLWFTPRIFRTPERDWPSFRPTEQELAVHLTIVENIIRNSSFEESRLHPKNFSSYQAIIYAGQFCYKLIKNAEIKRMHKEIEALERKVEADPRNRELKGVLREKKSLVITELKSVQDVTFMYDKVENWLIKMCQLEAFPVEYELLINEELLPKRNYYSRFTPFVDKNGVIRLRTRLTDNDQNRKSFGYDRICPILLPKKHHITDLIILKYHKTNKHMLEKNTVNMIKARFYIRHILFVVRRVIKSKCVFCIRYNARPEIPLMGDLPTVRLGLLMPAFSFTMADIAGPILACDGRKREIKRYIFVYTCLTTRAIHLELLPNLDTNSTLLALQSTINLRGAPVRIITDNGTNFLGAKNKLSDMIVNWNQTMLAKGIITKPIEWDFGPARAPHMQGAVERMVKLVKDAMKQVMRMLNERTEHLNDFTLRAILMEVVGLLNNRPIAFSAQYDTNEDFITPNSFLMLRANYQETPCSDNKTLRLNKNWEDIRKFTAILWDKWLKLYLPTILEREKWIDRSKPLLVGDLVITIDTGVTDSWRLGKVVKIKEGSNQQVRAVDIVLGKKSVIDKINVKSAKKLLELYKSEKMSIVSRPAIAVAKINI